MVTFLLLVLTAGGSFYAGKRHGTAVEQAAIAEYLRLKTDTVVIVNHLKARLSHLL